VTPPAANGVRLPERPARPQTRVNLLGALAATAVAVAALVVALVVEISPPHELAALVTAVVPVLGVVALPIVVSRARAEHDSDLAWFGAGLAVSVGAAALQTLSFPGVLGAGGPLHTGASGNALLYLAMHAAMAVGVLVGALGVPGRYRRWFVAAGHLLVLVSALGVLPLPRLVLAGGRYSSALIAAQLLVAWLIAVAAVVWVRRSGPSVTALRGWAGVALSLSGYDVLLSAISGQRYSSVWWASLALRVATYAVLAAGAGATVLAQLRRLEQYTDRELDRSDERLRGSMAVTNRLLDSAERFSRAVTSADVGAVLVGTGLGVTGLDRACVIVVDPDSGRFHAVASNGYDDESLRRLTRPSSREAAIPGAVALRTGRPVYSTPGRRPDADFPGLAQLPAHGSTESIAVLPLTAAAEVVGLLAVSGQPHTFDAAEREVLGALAAQAGQALQRALLYERQVRAAEVLQRGLLPQRLPAVPGIAMAARYAPGAAGLRVGGDWYDAIPVPGDRLALVIGDVMGKGVDAAARMSQIRGAVRVLAAVDPEPVAVAAGLDRMAGELAEDQIVTLVYLLIDPATGEGLIARLGHLPPLLVPPQGEPRVLDGAGSPPLGVPNAVREQAPLTVEPGAVLVLFTDGLVEERQTGLDVGLPALAAESRRLTDTGLDVEGFADAVLALGAADGSRPDDVCVLVVRRDEAGPVQDGDAARVDAAVTLAAEPTSGAAARRFVQRSLAGVPSDPERLETLVLLCSELVTNAVLHAAAPSQVRVRVRDGRVRLEVHDPSPHLPAPRVHDPEAPDGRGMALVAALADAWGIERGDGLTDLGKTVWVELELVDHAPDMDST
jgi:serine phosphatase RsbU (regulator of sigma subunit)/anti-sigma regulatory factor (Ser/Thr protein kinase)